MLRGSWRQLWLFLLLLLLLLLLPGAPEPRGTSRPWEGTDEPGSAWAWPGFQRLQEQLRAAGALSKRYWTLFSCQVWPDDCDEDEEAAARPLGKTPSPRPAVRCGAECDPGAAVVASLLPRATSGPAVLLRSAAGTGCRRGQPPRSREPHHRSGPTRIPGAVPCGLAARPLPPLIPALSRLACTACAVSQPTLALFEGAALDSSRERPLWTCLVTAVSLAAFGRRA